MINKVSVIIPTYKRSDFLQRAIDSILSQTYTNIEVIVVDDNTPDSNYRLETERKMMKYRNYSNVIYIKNQSNLGGALARNEGIFKACGDYITFLDDDDIYLPNKIATQVEYMVQNELDMSFTDVRINNSDDRLVDYREHHYVKSLSNHELLKQHIMHHLTPTGTYMFTRESIINIGGFDDVLVGQEFKLMLKTIESGMKIGYMSVAHVIQYLHDGERISIGHTKIEAETELFNFKKKYFKILNLSQRKYVKFRYHAVMMFVGVRSKKQVFAAKHFFRAFLCSPLYCLKETVSHFKKIYKYKTSTRLDIDT